MTITRLVKKSRAVIVKGPSTARNILFSQFDYWPTRPLRNDTIRDLPIYCVSMASAVRRRGIIRRQGEMMGLTGLRFVDAFVAANLDPAELQRQRLYDDAAANSFHGRSLGKSEIACSLSHGRVYEMIASSESDPVAMVIEDDALFIPSRLDRVDLDALPLGWEVAFLNSFIVKPPRRRISGSLYHGDAYSGSSAAYLVSKRGAQRLAKDYAPVVHCSDGYLGRKDLAAFMYYPDCVLNGSVCHYYGGTVQYLPEILKTKAGRKSTPVLVSSGPAPVEGPARPESLSDSTVNAA